MPFSPMTRAVPRILLTCRGREIFHLMQANDSAFTHCSRRAITFFVSNENDGRMVTTWSRFTISWLLLAICFSSSVFLKGHDDLFLGAGLGWTVELDLKILC